jgi:hypothetical protein
MAIAIQAAIMLKIVITRLMNVSSALSSSHSPRRGQFAPSVIRNSSFVLDVEVDLKAPQLAADD